jgi:hypothetical protein
MDKEVKPYEVLYVRNTEHDLEDRLNKAALEGYEVIFVNEKMVIMQLVTYYIPVGSSL